MSTRAHARAIARAAVAGADAGEAVRRTLSAEIGRLLREAGPDGGFRVVGAGKASLAMAAAAVELLGERIVDGAIAVPTGTRGRVTPIDLWEAGHPLPTVGSIAAAAEAMRIARVAGPGDTLLCLLSGGASAMWAAPPRGLGLDDVREVTRALLRAGAEISEMNLVRKHLSRIAGGGLTRAARSARVVTLAVSDVGGSPPDVIGSGPTLPVSGTFADALDVLVRHGVTEPEAVLRYLQRGAAGDLPALEGPAPGEFHIVAGLRDALLAAEREALRLGYETTVLSEALAGEARAAGADIAAFALQATRSGERPRALIWGGETTVTVRGEGSGGRCQELAVAAARTMNGLPGITVIAFGTDGVDGPTTAAGGLVDGGTVERARRRGYDPDASLGRNDSHAFLDAAGDLLVTGPTGTNVGDLVVALVD